MRSLLLLFPIMLGVARAEAQYTAEQRAAIEGNALRQQAVLRDRAQFDEWRGRPDWIEARDRAQRDAQALDRRAAPSGQRRVLYFAGPETAGQRARRLGQVIFAVTARGVIPRHLDPAGAPVRSVPQRTPGRLTFVTPGLAPGDPVDAEVEIAGAAGTTVSQFMTQVWSDSIGVYRVDLPPLRLGEYTLTFTATGPDALHHTLVQRLTARE
jgi:hypothetical protein